MAQGFIYLLISPNSTCVKIGGTKQTIRERLRGINSTASYAEHGPWALSDFLHVTDWQLVERRLHEQFGSYRPIDIPGVRELFDIPALEIRKAFRLIEPELRVGHEKTLELFKKRDLQLFLFKLFETAGLFGNLDIQGAWTLSLFPSTVRGRFYTLNIGPHEVAFAPILRGSEVHDHHLVVDRLIRDYPEAIKWIRRNDGTIEVAPYATARDRAVTIQFKSNFPDAERFFAIPGVRRALVAYWSEGLAEMREQNASRAFARYHNYDAVYALLEHSRARQNVTIQT